MKRVLSFVMTMVMIMSIIASVPVTVSASDDEGFTYELNSDSSSYTITGSNVELTGELVIPDTYNELPVTRIAPYAFDGCSEITSVIIPEGIISVGDKAFYQCAKLNSVTFPYSVYVIGYKATHECAEDLKHICCCESYASGYNFGIGETTIVHSGIETIPGSTATCENPGKTEGSWCSYCGEVFVSQQEIPQKEHIASDWITVTESTPESEGLKQKICTECETVLETEIILKVIDEVPEIQKIYNADKGVKITWKAVENAEEYKIYRRRAGSENWDYVDTVTKKQYIDTSAKNNVVWQYTVVATNSTGDGPFNNDGRSIKRVSTPKLKKISNSAKGVSITWGKISGATKYRVYRKAPGQSEWKYLKTVSDTNYIDKKVVSGKNYKYTVRAVNQNYSGYDSDGLSIKRLDNPKNIKAQKNKNNIKVTWAKVTGATAYRVYRRSSGNSWIYLGSTTKAYFVDKNVVKNKKYRYTVRAAKGDTYSGYYSNGPVVKYTGVTGINDSKVKKKKDVFNFYQAAVYNAKFVSGAGYTAKDWSGISSVEVKGNNSSGSIFENVFEDFKINPEDVKPTVYKKGSANAKKTFPGYNADVSDVLSATCVSKNETTYLITVKMRDVSDVSVKNNGVVGISSGLLSADDFDEIFDDPDLKNIIKRGNCENVSVKNYVIVAEITKDGRFLNLEHTYEQQADLSMETVVGSMDFTLGLECGSQYDKFIY